MSEKSRALVKQPGRANQALSLITQELKAVARRAASSIGRGPIFPSYGGQGDTYGGFGYQSLTSLFRTQRDIDYAVELGDLELSSLAMAGVKFLSTTLPEAPIQVMQPGADGKPKPVIDHEMIDLLNDPNDFY